MIEFFRDVLDGPLYIGTTILSVILIMAIIGFLMERKKLEKEAKSKVAVVTNQPKEVVPIEPVSVHSTISSVTVEPELQPQVVSPTSSISVEQSSPIENQDMNTTLEHPSDPNQSLEVASPVIIFEDPDLKKE